MKKALVDIARENNITPQAIHKRAIKYSVQLKDHITTDRRGKKYVTPIGEAILLTGLVTVDAVDVNSDHKPQLPQPYNNHINQCLACSDKTFLQAQLKEQAQQINELLISIKNLSERLKYEQQKNKVLLDYVVVEPKIEPYLPDLPELSQVEPQLSKPVSQKKSLHQRIISLFI